MPIQGMSKGGKKSDGSRRRKPTAKKTGDINALFKALDMGPATSREEIAQRMSGFLGEDVSVSRVDAAKAFVNENQNFFGFMVHYAQTGPNPSKSDRFFILPVDRTGVALTPDQKAAHAAGKYARLVFAYTTLERLSKMTKAEANQSQSHKELLDLQDLSDDFEFFAKKVAALLRKIA